MAHQDSWPKSPPWPEIKADIYCRSPKRRKRLLKRDKRKIMKKAGSSNRDNCISLFNKIDHPKWGYNRQKSFDLALVYHS